MSLSRVYLVVFCLYFMLAMYVVVGVQISSMEFFDPEVSSSINLLAV